MEQDMRFGLCNELFQDWDWQRALELTTQQGYTGWEIAPFTLGESPTALSADQRARLARQIQSAGVEVIGLHWLLAKTEGYHLTTNDLAVHQRTAEYLAELTRLCRDLGGSLMVLGSPQQRNFDASKMTHAQAEANAVAVIEQLLPALETMRVTLALEPLGPGEGNFWNHAAQAAQVVRQIDSPWVRLHLDVKAMSTEGKPIEEVILENSAWMHHFHANDPNLLGPGMGQVPFEPIFRALRQVDYQGWVSVEVFDYSPGIEAIAHQSMQNMRSALEASQSQR